VVRSCRSLFNDREEMGGRRIEDEVAMLTVRAMPTRVKLDENHQAFLRVEVTITCYSHASAIPRHCGFASSSLIIGRLSGCANGSSESSLGKEASEPQAVEAGGRKAYAARGNIFLHSLYSRTRPCTIQIWTSVPTIHSIQQYPTTNKWVSKETTSTTISTQYNTSLNVPHPHSARYSP
jgi:hypothetical protein